ncbi:MAG: hypothetical protein COB09_05650 [Thalassobium sp.]|nr:MAG: hypothetical protein COB09_05650 [Thalassobium sp.]
MFSVVCRWSLIFAAGLLPLAAVASDDPVRLYLGMGWGTGDGSHDWEYSNQKISTTHYDQDIKDFKLGIMFSPAVRLEFARTQVDMDVDTSRNDLSGMDLNLFFSVGNKPVRPYLTVGLGSYDYDDTASLVAGDDDLSGTAVNIGVGIFAPLSEHVELDIGYQEKRIEWQEMGSVTNDERLNVSTRMNYFNTGLRIIF